MFFKCSILTCVIASDWEVCIEEDMPTDPRQIYSKIKYIPEVMGLTRLY